MLLRAINKIKEDIKVIYEKDPAANNVAEVIIAKHRNGSTGTVYLDFDPNFTYFNTRPLDKSYLLKKDEQVSAKKKEGR